MKHSILSGLALLLALCLLSGCTAAPAEPAPSESSAPTESAAPIQTEAPTEEAAFRFTRENFPEMDGSTSLVPLGRAVASVLLGESPEDVSGLVQFNRTTQSFRNLKDGLCQLLLAGEPNPKVFDEMEEDGFVCEMETIAVDGLVFLVNEDNPVDSLTTEQIRGIYTGQITNWSEVGGNDAPIVPFQRNEGAGSQALMKKLVMGDTPMIETESDFTIDSMVGLMEAIKGYDNSANALGYSVYYYAHDMEMAQGLKLLKVDGVEPSKQTIRSGAYPHVNAYYCVINSGEPTDSPVRILYDWLLTEEGQRLIDREGYVSVMELPAS